MNILGVLPRGEYALCGVGQHVPELAMGDVISSSLEELWRSHPVLQKVRAGVPHQLKGVCARCLMKNACLGSCVASNYQVSGDILEPYWFCEKAEQEGLFPESRKVDRFQ
jgi:radical SAM protein with 4Fe4S-binding SPASM domain